MRNCKNCGKKLMDITKINKECKSEYPQYFRNCQITKTGYCSEICKEEYHKKLLSNK
jgi:hypothetical protein